MPEQGEAAAADRRRSCWPGTKANPNRFMYARPANSGPGRTLLMGLPYILGDTDPKDPEKGWDKTWAWGGGDPCRCGRQSRQAVSRRRYGDGLGTLTCTLQEAQARAECPKKMPTQRRPARGPVDAGHQIGWKRARLLPPHTRRAPGGSSRREPACRSPATTRSGVLGPQG